MLHGLPEKHLELIEGEDLLQILKRGPLPWTDLCDAFRQVADGLSHAHRRGIHHRDIKPANVMLQEDGGAVIVLAADDEARRLCERPAWIRGIDHRTDAHTLGVRDLTRSMSARVAGAKAGVGDDKVDLAELHAPFSTYEAVLTEALGLGDDTVINPSGGALAAHTMMASGLIRIGEAAQRISRGDADRAVATAASGPCLQQNLVAVLEGE